MIKRILLSTFLLLNLFTFAQNQVVNLGFENYDALGSDDEEPTGWSSFRNAGGGLSGFVNNQKIEQTTDTRPGSSGMYSTRIWATSVFGTTANGTMTTGQIQAGGFSAADPANHNKTILSNPDFNQTFTGLPDSLVVWIKTNMSSGGSQARVSATIHDTYEYLDPDGADANAASHVVGKAVSNFNTSGQWERISIPFDYASHPSNDPQYILITITTNATPGGGSANDEVFVDDMEFIYPANEVDIAPTTIQNLLENETGTMLTATENPTATSREWKFTTTSGSGYTSFATAQTSTTYTPQFATAGTYYVVCESNFNGSMTISNEVQINVTAFANAIAPTTTQNIFENQAGSLLTVSENIAADSREWKFTTTSGSGYTSFATAQTGMTYTPQFTTAGTYYVVCQSTLNGNTVTSNEVTVNVGANTNSISPAAAQNLYENQVGTLLTVSESTTANSREWKFSTTSGSGYASFATAQTGMTYAPQFASIGTYYVVCESDFNGQATISNEVTIIVSANSIDISPTTTQNIFENQAGNALTANETPTATNREWKFSTTSGSGYASFATAETGTSYTPLFFTAGTYYVVCEANFNGTMVTSNEVTIIVSVSIIPTVSITPASTQDIAANELGSVLTVNESEPSTSREWKFSMTSGSGYASFATVQTGNNYTPQFSTDGSFYIVCQSMINGSMITSNEVQINVTTFENNINPDYAQGVYLNQPVTTLEIEESIPADNRIWKIGTVAGGGYNPFTPNETGTTITPVFDVVGSYFIICQSTLNGNTVTSNEIEIQVFEPNTVISPSSFQNLYENEQGNQLTIVETPVATSREWKYAPSTTGTYQSFATAETGTNYTPFFADAGIYYVRCESEIYGNTYISNTITITVNEYMTSIAPTDEQTIIVNTDGDMITVAENTNPTAREWKFSTTSGGTYTSFSSTETSTNYTPNFDTEGTYYVVCESNFNGTILTSNEVKINVIALPTISISPTDEQNITANQFGNTLFLETGNNTPNAAEWLYSTTSGVGYTSFMTNETADQYKPLFDTEGTYYVVCDAEILNETYRSNEVIINVSEPVGIFDYEKADFAVYSFDKNIVIDLSQKEMKNATISIINIEGKIVFEKVLESYTTNRIELPTIQEGIYFYSIRNVNNQFNGKLLLK